MLFDLFIENRVRRNSSKYNTPLFPDTPVFLPPLVQGQFSTTLSVARGGDITRLTQSVTIAIPSLRSLRHAHRKVSFSHYATRSPTKRTTLVGSLVLSVELGTQKLAALRLEAPSLNKHIPLISTLRMSIRSDKAISSAIINYFSSLAFWLSMI